MTWDAPAVTTPTGKTRAHWGDFTGAGGVLGLAATPCAFGNTPGGGVAVVGLAERSESTITGARDPAAAEQASVSQALRAVRPLVAVTSETLTTEGKQIVVAEIQGLNAPQHPCKTGGQAQLRQADGDYSMSATEQQRLLAMRDGPCYDAGPVGHATLASLYALGEYPQQSAPSLSVTAAVATGPGSAGGLADFMHLDGPVPDLLDASMEWVRRNLRTGIRVGADGHNYNHAKLPLGAVRELIANALVHRDLGPHPQTKRVEIRLLPERLVITGPGRLWGVSREQLGTAAGKSAVNEHLYGICTHLSTAQGARVTEGEGGGIGEVQRALHEWPTDPPIFIDQAVTFTAVVMRPHAGGGPPQAPGPRARLGDPQTRILTVLAAGALDRESISEHTGLTRSQTRYALEKLIAADRVVTHGGLGARNTTYSRAEDG